MGKKYRPLSENNKYYLPKETYLTAIHYSLQYPIWDAELKTVANTGTGIRYDKERVQTSIDSDPTAEAAIKLEEVAHKINLIDDAIKMTAKGMDYWLRLGVCYGLTFEQLKGKDLPCERKLYYQIRRHYYYELSKRI